MYNYRQRLTTEDAQNLRREGGRYLRDLRTAAGLTQTQLSQLLNLEIYTFISQVETGRGRIPPDSYEAWAEALNVDARQFVQTIMRFYDPVTHRILFEQVEAPVG